MVVKLGCIVGEQILVMYISTLRICLKHLGDSKCFPQAKTRLVQKSCGALSLADLLCFGRYFVAPSHDEIQLPGGEIPTRVCWQRNIVWPHYLKTNVRRRPKIWWRSRPEWLGELGVGRPPKDESKRSVENWFNNWCSLTTYFSVSKKGVKWNKISCV